MIVAGFLMLLVVAPLAVFWGDSRIVAGLACLVAAVALWRAAVLRERERMRAPRPHGAADVIKHLSTWVAQRRRDPIVSQAARDRGAEYAQGVQDGAYATLDEVLDRLGELLRMLPPTEPRGRRGRRRGARGAGSRQRRGGGSAGPQPLVPRPRSGHGRPAVPGGGAARGGGTAPKPGQRRRSEPPVAPEQGRGRGVPRGRRPMDPDIITSTSP